MSYKLLLSSNAIYHKEFEGTKPGYDALQVDTFLDVIIKDYETFEKYTKETDETIASLNLKVEVLNKQLNQAQSEAAILKSKMGEIENNENANTNNLELLKRISSLEKALAKVGINPNTIK